MSLIYVAHPFTGDEEKNLKEAALIYKQLVQENPELTFISPLMAFGGLGNLVTYHKALNMCLALLSRCDGLVLTGNWEESKGCQVERNFCRRTHKTIAYAKQGGRITI